MKHTSIIIVFLLTAAFSNAQTTFKTDADAIEFAQQLAGSNPVTIDSINCRQCIDVQSKAIRVQFWKLANGYRLASITGTETDVKNIWQKTFAADPGKRILNIGNNVLSMHTVGNKCRIELRQYTQ